MAEHRHTGLSPTLQPGPLSLTGEVQLLRILSTLRTAEVSLLTLPAVLTVWRAWRGDATWALGGWVLGMALLALHMASERRRFPNDERRLEPQALMQRWRPRALLNAALFGLGWVMPLALLPWPLAPDVAVAVYVLLCGVTAGTASYAAAVLRTFYAVLAAMWLPATAVLPWVWPPMAPVLVPAALLFVWVNLRHAQAMHGFMVRQIQLEEHSQRLAVQFKQARDQATEALREKNFFLSTASHDLRQPVHAMSMLVEAIRHRSQDDALAPLLRDLHRSMGALNLMFNALLDLSALEAGKQAQQCEVLPLKPVVEDVCSLFREEAAARGLRLRCVLPRHAEPRVWADRVLLRQALVNLVHNALRYTVRGGLLVAVRRQGAHWQLGVWDTGIGIGDEVGAQIFSPHYRHPHAWRMDAAGHGLGLAVVARCASRLGATCGYRSRLDRGSHVWLSLRAWERADADTTRRAPLTSATPTSPSLLAPHANPASHPAPMHWQGACLVLDDDPAVRSAWQALLGSWGVELCCVDSAAQARAALDAGWAPLAIFCDQRLRSADSGFAVLKELLARCPNASGAMVSGEFDSPELAEADAEGYMVLRKPLEAPALLAVLTRWLGTPPPRA